MKPLISVSKGRNSNVYPPPEGGGLIEASVDADGLSPQSRSIRHLKVAASLKLHYAVIVTDCPRSIRHLKVAASLKPESFAGRIAVTATYPPPEGGGLIEAMRLCAI